MKWAIQICSKISFVSRGKRIQKSFCLVQSEDPRVILIKFVTNRQESFQLKESFQENLD